MQGVTKYVLADLSLLVINTFPLSCLKFCFLSALILIFYPPFCPKLKHTKHLVLGKGGNRRVWSAPKYKGGLMFVLASLCSRWNQLWIIPAEEGSTESWPPGTLENQPWKMGKTQVYPWTQERQPGPTSGTVWLINPWRHYLSGTLASISVDHL